MRHATAEPTGPDGLDASRRLADVGHDEAASLAKQIAAAEPKPRRIIASPAVRAQQTAIPIAEALGLTLETEARIACNRPTPIARDAVSQSTDGTMYVGHNPTLGELLGTMVGGIAAPPARFRKAQACLLTSAADSPQPGDWTVEILLQG
ncbi:MAG: histidine phosphatase family protein [Planctomycetota bacterium]